MLGESLAALQGIGDLHRATLPLQHLGYVAYLQGEYVKAESLLQQALLIARDVHYPRGSAAALNVPGKVTHVAGEAETARSYLHEALSIATMIRAWPLVIDTHESISRLRTSGSSDEGTDCQVHIQRLLPGLSDAMKRHPEHC